MKYSAGVLCFVVSLCTLGCGHKDAAQSATTPQTGSLIGSWENPNVKGQTVILTFRKSGTLLMKRLSNNGKGVGILATAAYHLSGDKYSMKPTDLELIPQPNSSAKTRALIAAEDRKLKSKAAYKKMKTENGTISWKDKNTFVLQDTSGTVVQFKRRS